MSGTCHVILAALAMLSFWPVNESVAMPLLVATNIMGTDGTVSMMNAGTPEVPLIIDQIVGLAATDPAPPGDNLIICGRNAIPDIGINDTYFQASGSAGPLHAQGTPPASAGSHVLLLEATVDGVSGSDPIEWHAIAYQDDDGSGSILPTEIDVLQSGTTIGVLGSTITVAGQIVPGDKIVAWNGGVTNGGTSAYVEIDGDGVPDRTNQIRSESFSAPSGNDTNTTQDFNNATLTYTAWSIDGAGNFISGHFDVTFDTLTRYTTWPGGDQFDVVAVPEPTSLVLLCVGSACLRSRRRRSRGRL